ncbi:hypothetical protein [Umezawaea sp. NPDC059074]|uniref:hypothetical protein n=1 Tax=Umezawaea sp. NPDC059074 TaxID=3346716 RepID=UPI0036CBEB5F
MLTFAVLVLLFGVCLLVACLTAVLLKVGELRERRIVEGTPTIAVGELRGGESRVAVVGTTAFGPGGPVVGPVSGEECAWFRVWLTRSPSRRADEDGGEDVLLDVASPTPPALVDRSGAVLIDPGLLAEPPNLNDPVATEQVLRLLHGGSAADWPSLIPRGLLEDKRSHESVQLKEVRLPVGRVVYVVAGVGRGPVALRRTRHYSVLTTDDAAAVLRRTRERAASSGQLARALGVAGTVVTAVSAVAIFLLV